MTQQAPRDFGDSAGYGHGGSDIDYHEVGDADAVKRPNPLDVVVHTDEPPAGDADDVPSDQPAGPHAKAELTDETRTPGSGALPSTKDGEADAGVG